MQELISRHEMLHQSVYALEHFLQSHSPLLPAVLIKDLVSASAVRLSSIFLEAKECFQAEFYFQLTQVFSDQVAVMPVPPLPVAKDL